MPQNNNKVTGRDRRLLKVRYWRKAGTRP